MRLIDAKELERQIKEVFQNSNPVLMGQMLRWIRKQTTIDAVPVVMDSIVRCKDCANYHEFISGHRCVHFNGGDGRAYQTSPDDFCSYGERR